MRNPYIFLFVLVCVNVFAQNPEIKTDVPNIIPPSPTVAALMKFEEVPVSNYTGIPNIAIPLYSTDTHAKNINLSLSLSYHSAGTAVDERASDVGLGWSLIAGGSISRTVRGLPDEIYDIQDFSKGQGKIGLYQTNNVAHPNNYEEIVSYYAGMATGPSTTTEYDVANDFLWNTTERGMYDTEYDLWQFNFMGKSGRFTIRKNPTTHLLEIADLNLDCNLKIVNICDPDSFEPLLFKVYDEFGNEYIFDVKETTKTHSTTDIMHQDNSLIMGNPTKNMLFTSSFHLSEIIDNNEKPIVNFTYNNNDSKYVENVEDYSTTENVDSIGNIQGWFDVWSTTYEPSQIHNIDAKSITSISSRMVTVKKLNQILVQGKCKIDLDFQKGREDDNFIRADSSYVFKGIVVKDLNDVEVKKVTLEHFYSTTIKKRMMLQKVNFENFINSKKETYMLEYKEKESYYDGIIQKDKWGYFNLRPSSAIEGRKYREVNRDLCTIETLQKMTLPTGGSIIYDFEANRYSYSGSTMLSDFDGNIYNWNELTASHTLDSSNPTYVDFFTVDEEQEVYFASSLAFTATLPPSHPNYSFVVINQTTLDEYEVIEYDLFNSDECEAKRTLPEGTYTVEFRSLDLSFPGFTANFTVNYKNKNSNDYKFLYGGGNRIKKIGYFAQGDVPQNYYGNESTYPLIHVSKEKHFAYDNFANSVYSSGSLVSGEPIFEFPLERNYYFYATCTGGPCFQYIFGFEFTKYTDSNNIKAMKTGGADVGYQNATVSETDNGRTQYTYTSPIDFPETMGLANTHFPYIPTSNYDYKRGLVLKELVFNQANDTLVETRYDYDYVEDDVELTKYGLTTNYIGNNNVPFTWMFEYYADYLGLIDFFDACVLGTPPYVSYFTLPCSFATSAVIEPRLYIEFNWLYAANGWAKLETKTTKNYFYPSGPTPEIVETVEGFTYHSNNKRINEHTSTNSIGQTLKTKYYYHSGDAPNHHNRISDIEKIESYMDSELLSTSNIIYSDNYDDNVSYLPRTIQTAKAVQTLEDRLDYKQYDEFSNPTEIQQVSGTVVSYIWGYNKTQPIAKIENASNVDIAGELSMDYDDIDEGDMGLIDDLRASLPNAMITTYTYRPLVGVSSITDPKGEKTIYEYDEFNRLQFVRDEPGNILSENQYEYLIGDAALNSVLTATYKTPTDMPLPFSSSPITDVAISKTFFDGLGRPIQQKAFQQSNTGGDIVTHIGYDDWGRQPKEYLPYVTRGSSLDFETDAEDATLNYSYYNSEPPFSEKVFEASPLNRVFEQSAPGTDWALASEHTIKFDYQTNDDGDLVIYYQASSQWDSGLGLYDPTLLDWGPYAINELQKTITKNENWESGDGDNNTTQEFKDKEGHLILKRTFGVSVVSGTETNTIHDTYYVYDQYGNLSYVLPPLVSGTIDQGVLDNLCYQYKYDLRNRLVEKKLPGKQWEYIVYNKVDKVVATGPALSPFTDGEDPGWLITKYDAFGRAILTAWKGGDVSNGDRKDLQHSYNNAVYTSEGKNSSVTTVNNVSFKYSNSTLPTSDYDVLTVNYFDDYDFPGAPTTFPDVMGDESQEVFYDDSTKPIGLPTGSWVRIVEDSNTSPVRADISHSLYDAKAHLVRSRTNNYLTGYTQIDNKVNDFTGKVYITETSHKRASGSKEIFITEAFSYTDQDQLFTNTHTTDGDPQLIAANTYDELGKLISKRVGDDDITTFAGLQEVNYNYNIRGWLTDINDISHLGSDLFAFHINYNTAKDETNYNGKELYNGNISETYWKSASDNVLRKYGYAYDDLNRLKSAVYQKPDAAVVVTNSYNETLKYDKNGNIMGLLRHGDLDNDSFTIAIDDLVYTYDQDKQNQLVEVSDLEMHPEGFSDGTNSTNDYAYDDYGNMTKDANKGIDTIKYNHLNLPQEIIFNDTSKKIEYLYDGTGRKVWKKITDGTNVALTDYLGIFQYTGTSSTSMNLEFFSHAEGYVKHTDTGGTLVLNPPKYNYVFNYTDHLGNIRMSYAWDYAEEEIKILEENHYYPFGLKHKKYNTDEYEFVYTGPEGMETEEGYYIGTILTPATGSLPYQYKFQGQERQDELNLNWDSFKWRNYDYAIGRFMSIDPLAEDYTYNSPYAFAENKVISFRELEGLEGVPVNPTQQWNAAFKEMGQTFAGALDKMGAEIKGFFTVSHDVAPLTTVDNTTEVTVGTNFLNFVNAKQFDQSTTVTPFTFNVETKSEVKVTAKATGTVGLADVTTKNTTSKNTSTGKTTNETKAVVGKGENGVFVSNKTNAKTGENTTRAGVQVESKTQVTSSTTIKVGASFSVGQKEKKR